MIALIDNYDSFTYNLYQYLSEFSKVEVYRNDEITVEELKKKNPSGIVISPGPGQPKDAGISIDLIRELGSEIPILGICLGHQAIGVAYGGIVSRALEIVHGKKSKIIVRGNDIFEGLSRKVEVMRYHSLIIDRKNLPKDLEVIAETEVDNLIMAIKHKKFKVYGLQFHPESIYTLKGRRIIQNFVEVICSEN